MAFFTADICDEYSDKSTVLGPGFSNYGGAEKCQGEIITIKLDRNNSDLIALLRDEDGTGKVVVVDVEEQTQIERATARDSNKEEQIKKIIASQMDRETRRHKADDIINNSGSLTELEEQVKILHNQYLENAKKKM